MHEGSECAAGFLSAGSFTWTHKRTCMWHTFSQRGAFDQFASTAGRTHAHTPTQTHAHARTHAHAHTVRLRTHTYFPISST